MYKSKWSLTSASKMQDETPEGARVDELIRRTRARIVYESDASPVDTLAWIRSEGFSDERSFLIYQAARILAKDCP